MFTDCQVQSAPQKLFFMFVFSLFRLVPRDEALVIRIAEAIFALIVYIHHFSRLRVNCQRFGTPIPRLFPSAPCILKSVSSSYSTHILQGLSIYAHSMTHDGTA